jgi:hypothetical protein
MGVNTPMSKEKSWVLWSVPVIPVTVGSIKQEDCIGVQVPGEKTILNLQNNQSKKGWRCDSSSRAPASQG